jgi:hypothetical protein
MAVGSTEVVTSRPSPLSEIWNGKAWRVLATPSRLGRASLTAVSCPSATSCLAVGDDRAGAPIFDAWKGTAWRTLPPPDTPARETLTGLACTSPSRCIAVGARRTGPSSIGVLAERWNGTAWTQLPPPVPAGAVSSSFAGISCPAASACMATGQFSTSTAVHTLAEWWDGTSWAVLATTDPPDGPHAFGAVSCASATACMAAGDRTFPSGPAVEVWDGSTWSVLALPVPAATEPVLGGVACTSAASCMVTGGDFDGSSLFADRWNGGTSWSRLPMHSPSLAFARVIGMSCASASHCLAVGAEGSLGIYAGFAQAWDGSRWRAVRTRRVEVLDDISCPRWGRCLAAGYYLADSDDIKILAEAWNGTTWRLANRPGPAGFLDDVSCVSASFCMGIGGIGGFTSATWNGTRWTPVTASPSRGLGGQVSCTAATFCMASGGGRVVRATEVWRGTRWRPAPFPSPVGATGAVLGSVSCTRPVRCLAVGSFTEDEHGGGPFSTLAGAWNGHTWRILPSPDPGPDSGFGGVSCLPRSGCMAIGHYVDKKGASRNFAAWWDRKKWRVLALHGGVAFNSISCARATSCMVVRNRLASASGLTSPGLAERWNGRTWRLTRTGGRGFTDVSCPAPRRCIAVGQAGLLTLIERWNGTRWRRLKSVNP